MLILNELRDLFFGLLIGGCFAMIVALVVGFVMYVVKVIKILIGCIEILLYDEDCCDPKNY